MEDGSEGRSGTREKRTNRPRQFVFSESTVFLVVVFLFVFFNPVDLDSVPPDGWDTTITVLREHVNLAEIL